MRAGDACNHDPPLTNTLQVWRLSPSMGLHSGQGRSRATNSPRALSGRHSAKYASYVHCVYKGSCRTTSLDSNTRTRCARVWSQSDSCGPLVRRSKYLRVPPNYLACYTSEAQGFRQPAPAYSIHTHETRQRTDRQEVATTGLTTGKSVCPLYERPTARIRQPAPEAGQIDR